MSVPVDGIKKSKSNVDEIISPLAQKELKTVISSAMDEVKDIMHMGGVPLAVAKQKLDNKLEEMANIILTDIDGADGKYDGHITKAVAEKKLHKLEEVFKEGPYAQYASVIFKKAEEAIKMLPDSKNNKAAALKFIDTKIEKGVADLGKELDFNKDGFLDVRDVLAFKLKTELKALSHSKGSIVVGAADYKDIDIASLFEGGQLDKASKAPSNAAGLIWKQAPNVGVPAIVEKSGKPR